MEQRLSQLEEKVAELEGRVPEQPTVDKAIRNQIRILAEWNNKHSQLSDYKFIAQVRKNSLAITILAKTLLELRQY